MAAARYHALRALLREHDGVVSFDVFDTLLWRRYPRPVEVFHDIPHAASTAGGKLPVIDASLFAAARRTAEVEARRLAMEHHGSWEVTLADVHERLATMLGWDLGDQQLIDDLRAAELAAEAAAVVGDRELLAVVGDLQGAGRRVIVVSDTYYSEHDLRGLLAAGGYDPGGFERVFVSSAFGVPKAHGLFDVIVDELDIPARRLLHVGDLPGADDAPVRRLGGRVVRWPVARDEAIDLAVSEAGTRELPMRTIVSDEAVTAADAGVTALRARLVPPDDLVDVRSRRIAGYERFGRLIYGPVLAGFANWICRRAEEFGLDRLYFFQREGALLAECVRRTSVALGRPLETEVLAVSRASLAPARVRTVNVHYLRLISYGRRPRRAAEVLADIGLDPWDVPRWGRGGRVSSADADDLYDRIATDPELQQRVQADLERRRASMYTYLRSHVVLDEPQIGVVDLGWAGSIQSSLSDALGQLGFAGTVRGFYLATNEGALHNVTGDNRMEGFVANLGLPGSLKGVFRNLEIVEQCCLERTGSVRHYDDDGSPVRAPDDIGAGQWAAIAAVQAGGRAFVEEWVAHSAGTAPSVSSNLDVWRAVVRDALIRFCDDPTAEEIELFRDWRHDDNRGTSSVERLVPLVFDESSPGTAALAQSLGMSELLWESAVSTLNEPVEHVTELSVSAVVGGRGRATDRITTTAVGRRVGGDLVVVYVGGEAQRLEDVRLSLACGPSIAKLRRISIEVEAGDESEVERITSWRHVRLGVGAQAISKEVAIVKGQRLRLSIALGTIAKRLAADQRLRVIAEMTIEPFAPDRPPLVQTIIGQGEAAVEWAAQRATPIAVRLLSEHGRSMTKEVLEGLRRRGVIR